MCDMFALRATAQGVAKAQEKLGRVRSSLACAKVQSRQRPPLADATETIDQIVGEIAEVQGILDAVLGWLAMPGEEDHV